MVFFLFFMGLCLGAGILGAIFTSFSVKSWYLTIRKPSWNPPNKLFGPVWSLLYIMMAFAAWRIFLNTQDLLAPALIVFYIQLFLNALWSGSFFGLRNPLLALFNIALLFCAIIVTMILFFQIDRFSGMLFVPYLFWVSFAAFLNYTIVKLNR